jgi:hypothetical protein
MSVVSGGASVVSDGKGVTTANFGVSRGQRNRFTKFKKLAHAAVLGVFGVVSKKVCSHYLGVECPSFPLPV